MLERRSQAHATLATSLDVAAVVLCYASLLECRHPGTLDAWWTVYGHLALLVGMVVAIVFWSLATTLYGNTSRRWTTFAWEASAIAEVVALASPLCAVVAMLSFGNSQAVHLLWPFPLLAFALLLTVHYTTRVVLGELRRRGHNLRHVVLVGQGALGRRYAGIVRSNPHLGLRIARRIPCDGPSWTARLIQVLHERTVDAVVLAVPISDPLLPEATAIAEREGKEVRVILDRLGTRISTGITDAFYGVPMLAFVPRSSRAVTHLAKRGLDLTGAVLLFALTLPLLVLAAVLILADDPDAPLFFRQVRVGLNGRRFVLFKLRTMVPDADRTRGALQALNEMGGPVFKIRNDPRVTRPGRFLRRFSVDELPQLWNVIRGDMSLVGPRPPLPEEVTQYEDHFRRRLAVRPGLTGPWQVEGRNDVDFEAWMDLDLDYVDHWSLGRDISILARTFGAVLSGRGAS